MSFRSLLPGSFQIKRLRPHFLCHFSNVHRLIPLRFKQPLAQFSWFVPGNFMVPDPGKSQVRWLEASGNPALTMQLAYHCSCIAGPCEPWVITCIGPGQPSVVLLTKEGNEALICSRRPACE